VNLLLVLGRVLLGGILIIAGAAKLANRVETRHALRSFGTPDRLVPALSWFLPVAELLCGAGVMVPATARWGAVGALGLLIVFLAAIAWNLMRGRRPDCRCFGHLHSAPIGWRMVTRNLALGTVAGLTVLQPERAAGLPYPSWSLTVGESVAVGLAVASCALAAAAVWLLLGLLKQHGRLLLRLDALEARLSAETPTPHRTGESDAASSRFGLPVGADAPPFALPDLDGRTVSLDELRARGRTLLLLFMDPGCGPCRSLLPEVASWRREQQGRLTVVMVSRGDAGANRSKFELSDIEILLQADDEIAERYQALATPSAVVVDVRGKVASPVAQGAAAIRQLAARATEPRRQRERKASGARARRGGSGPARDGDPPDRCLRAARVWEDRRGGGWSLEVHDGAGWRTWWRSDSAPDAWRGPVQAVLDATNWTPIARGADLGEVVVSGGGRGLRTGWCWGDSTGFRVVWRSHARRPRAAQPGQSIRRGRRRAAFNAGQFAGGRAWGWLVRDGRSCRRRAQDRSRWPWR
jgi:peroxiredoxin